MEKNTICIYLATINGTPLFSSENFDKLVEKLDEYNGVEKGLSHKVRYEPYETKYPDDLEGTYYYKDNKGTEDLFKIYCIEHYLK